MIDSKYKLNYFVDLYIRSKIKIIRNSKYEKEILTVTLQKVDLITLCTVTGAFSF